MQGLATELSDAGINLDFAPSVDLHHANSPGIGARGRSYGANPAVVSHWAEMQIAALGAHGVASAIKHFPGHRSAKGDTHHRLTDVTAFWSRSELMPFASLISTGHIQAVMTSHLVNRDLDASGGPVTFSRPIVHDLLRGKLKFEGLIITDDLGMGALVHNYGLATIAARSISNGHDLLIFGQNASAVGLKEQSHLPINNLFGLVLRSVELGIAAKSIDPSEVRRSLTRIVKFKATLFKSALVPGGTQSVPQGVLSAPQLGGK